MIAVFSATSVLAESYDCPYRGRIEINHQNDAFLKDWGSPGNDSGPYAISRSYGQILIKDVQGGRLPIILNPMGDGVYKYDYGLYSDLDTGSCFRTP